MTRLIALPVSLLLVACAANPEFRSLPMQLDCPITNHYAEVEVDMVIDGVRTVLGVDFERYYPEQAERAGLSGVAVIDCSQRTGFGPCEAVSADPPDAGFDAAAERMSRLLRNTQREIRIEFHLIRGPEPQPKTCLGTFGAKP